MNQIKIKNIFAAVSKKSSLNPFLEILDHKSVTFWGTEGTVKYLKSKGFNANSVISGFDFDGRVKTLDRTVFVRILADRRKKRHMNELQKLALRTPGVSKDVFAPFDLVIVDLYVPDPKIFPESMDIGGQALIRSAIKNYKNIALAFDLKSMTGLTRQLKVSKGTTDSRFRKRQAARALKFIAKRCGLEAKLL